MSSAACLERALKRVATRVQIECAVEVCSRRRWDGAVRLRALGGWWAMTLASRTQHKAARALVLAIHRALVRRAWCSYNSKVRWQVIAEHQRSWRLFAGQMCREAITQAAVKHQACSDAWDSYAQEVRQAAKRRAAWSIVQALRRPCRHKARAWQALSVRGLRWRLTEGSALALAVQVQRAWARTWLLRWQRAVDISQAWRRAEVGAALGGGGDHAGALVLPARSIEESSQALLSRNGDGQPCIVGRDAAACMGSMALLGAHVQVLARAADALERRPVRERLQRTWMAWRSWEGEQRAKRQKDKYDLLRRQHAASLLGQKLVRACGRARLAGLRPCQALLVEARLGNLRQRVMQSLVERRLAVVMRGLLDQWRLCAQTASAQFQFQLSRRQAAAQSGSMIRRLTWTHWRARVVERRSLRLATGWHAERVQRALSTGVAFAAWVSWRGLSAQCPDDDARATFHTIGELSWPPGMDLLAWRLLKAGCGHEAPAEVLLRGVASRSLSVGRSRPVATAERRVRGPAEGLSPPTTKHLPPTRPGVSLPAHAALPEPLGETFYSLALMAAARWQLWRVWQAWCRCISPEPRRRRPLPLPRTAAEPLQQTLAEEVPGPWTLPWRGRLSADVHLGAKAPLLHAPLTSALDGRRWALLVNAVSA
eukprot:CAMPEP_0180704954 /NCGR_PEP_ID=MMETSP1038_2-20121128/7420_1 /TAXON_ID=632150 /ORGANISM="Azadinium spinosum, Strain 3D9" /LENGTH=654 /DNA_ID=CAMNT_0022736799 /DNA_START=38 /DNA_END=1999 /DNA_ORIENTATION=-